jgi:hypothetical protein
MDIRLADYHLSVEWRERDGFALTADEEHGFGEGADEVYPDLSGALPRIIHLVQNRLETVPPYPVRIKELREKLFEFIQSLEYKIVPVNGWDDMFLAER